MQSDRYLSLELSHVSVHMIIFACSCSEFPCAPRLFLSLMPCLIWECSLDNERERGLDSVGGLNMANCGGLFSLPMLYYVNRDWKWNQDFGVLYMLFLCLELAERILGSSFSVLCFVKMPLFFLNCAFYLFGKE
jgi:hypothetical protein